MEIKKKKVLVTSTNDFPVDIDVVKRILDDLAFVNVTSLPHKVLSVKEEDMLIKELKDVDVLFVRPGIITERVIEASEKLKMIVVHGAGVDQVDVKAATEKGILVTNAPGGNAQAVAELTFGLLLALIRRIPQANRQILEGKWNEARFLGTELRGKTIGIIGLGAIGSKVSDMAKAFGLSVLAYDPYVSTEKATTVGAKLVDLDALLSESDFVTIHCALTDKNRNLIDQNGMKLMKKTAFLINVSRGEVVKEASIYTALEEGIIAGAALDVLEIEPPGPNNPLFQLDNVVITPHMAGSTRESLKNIAKTAAEDMARVFRGEKPKNLVNVEVLSMKQARARLNDVYTRKTERL